MTNSKPSYPGRLVLNTNVGKKMHLLAQYYTFFGRKEGVYSDAYDSLVSTIVKRRQDDMRLLVFTPMQLLLAACTPVRVARWVSTPSRRV